MEYVNLRQNPPEEKTKTFFRKSPFLNRPFKEEGLRCVQHPDTGDRVWYAAGKSTLVGMMQENGRILSELGEHDLFEIPLEYGREAIFFRKSQAILC